MDYVTNTFNPSSRMIFINQKYEGLRLHTHLKGLAMAQCKLPSAVFIDQKIVH